MKLINQLHLGFYHITSYKIMDYENPFYIKIADYI